VADEHIRRDRESLARFADAAQVHGRDQDDEADGHLDADVSEDRDRRDDVVDAAGDGYGDGHHIVDEQCRCDDQSGFLA
jgi:hypothetical protein